MISSKRAVKGQVPVCTIEGADEVVKLTGQLIWYKDHVLRNYEYERMATELDELRQRMDIQDAEEANQVGVAQIQPPDKEAELEQKEKPQGKQLEIAEKPEAGASGEPE